MTDPMSSTDGPIRPATEPKKDCLSPHLRQAANYLVDLHDAVEKGSSKQGLHHLLSRAESYIAQDATLPPRERVAATPQAYVKLRRTLDRAFEQAAFGKGKDRHVKEDGQAFEDQPICSLQRLYGNGYAFGQVGKKMEESVRLPKDQAVAELYGGIIYLAAAIIVREEGE